MTRLRQSAVVGVLALALTHVSTGAQTASSSVPAWLAPYREATTRLLNAATADDFAWRRLAELTDLYSGRISGSEALAGAITWASATMTRDGLENVRTEPVMVPHWIRGHEAAEITAPQRDTLTVLGLGDSVSTPAAGIEGEVLVVTSFDDLRRHATDARGRIVLFNTPFMTYGETVAYPDTVVGADSHTTMINGLSVLGWGVGGIEAEAAMLGQPSSMLIPQVLGVRLTGALQKGITATDLVLTITELLRKQGVVGKFVEFFGEGLKHLTIADRATLGNMCPEYGSTVAIFPIDDMTLEYLRLTGRDAKQIALVEAYAKAQGLFRTADAPDAVYSETLELDLSTVEPSLAGPRRPQDRVPLAKAKTSFSTALDELKKGVKATPSTGSGQAAAVATQTQLEHGSVVIAAITSCTNTSNPSVMIGAGLLARNAVAKGLRSKPWVKTSLAPGSQVVAEYLEKAGLQSSLDALGFNLVGFGCTTCIGNSGPLPAPISKAINDNDVVACAVLSGNRNFEARIHPAVRAAFLASPPLVVAFALAGRVDIDFASEPLGNDANGQPVYLKDLWPAPQDVAAVLAGAVKADDYRKIYGGNFAGAHPSWQSIAGGSGALFAWPAQSTYIKPPPFLDARLAQSSLRDLKGARALAILGNSITTDHISPISNIRANSVAGAYLQNLGVAPPGVPTPTIATSLALLLANLVGLMRAAWWVPLAIAGLFAVCCFRSFSRRFRFAAAPWPASLPPATPDAASFPICSTGTK